MVAHWILRSIVRAITRSSAEKASFGKVDEWMN